MEENTKLISKIISYIKKEWLILSLFILIISFSQSFILKPHTGFGFSPDDVWLFSDFLSLGQNPFSKWAWVYKEIGSHGMSPLYYNGALFSFFGFNYSAYNIASLIFKIFSILFFYFLIQVLFKNKFLSFLSGLLFSFHYASFGSMEMVTRTQDYLVIIGMSTFLITFFLISTKKLNSILWNIISSLILFITFLTNPIRAFPLIPFILFLSLLTFLKQKSSANLYLIIKNLFIYALPFIGFLILVRGSSGVSFGNLFENIQRASLGNLQLLLTPIATLGSIFLTGDGLKFLSIGFATWDFGNYFKFLLLGPSLVFGIVTVILFSLLPGKPKHFFLRVFITNFLLELLFFYIINIALNLPSKVKVHYDPSSLIPSTILGLYILTVTFYIFLEWLKNRNIYLKLYLLGISFAITFIWFTWVFQDFISTPLGIHGYTTIPSMGVSAALGSIFLLAYTKLKTHSEFTKRIAPIIFLILFPYFLFSNSQTQTYLNKLVYDGNSAKDQIYLKDKFWASIDKNNPCNKLFYFDTQGDLLNGTFYSYIMLDRFDKWYNLYKVSHFEKSCPVGLILNDQNKLISSYTNLNKKPGFNYQDSKGIMRFFRLEDFYAFKLQNRDIYNIRNEIVAIIK